MRRFNKAFWGGLMLGVVLGVSFGFWRAWEFSAPAFETDFVPGVTNRFVDPLYPPGRWLAPMHGAQELVAEPGYTDVFVPAGFDFMEVSLDIDLRGRTDAALGIRTATGPDLQAIPPESSTFTARFPLAEASRDAEGRVALIFSVPSLRTVPGSITVQGLRVRFLRAD